MPKKIKGGYCYLCGTYRNTLTRDHIPPKNLAPKTPNSVFLYAPACSDCNNKLSHDESKFRDFLVFACIDSNLPEVNDALTAFRDNVQRNDLGRAGRMHKDLQRILQGMKRRETYTPNNIYLGTSSTFSPAPDIDIRGILLKIARGLHFVYTNEIIPDSYARAACLYGDTPPYPPMDMIDNMHVLGNIGTFLKYRGGWATDDTKTGAWYMMFYDKLIGLAIFGQPHPKGDQGNRANAGVNEGKSKA